MFEFNTDYNLKSLTVMAKALRKTVRKKHSRRSHAFGWIMVFFLLIYFITMDKTTLLFSFRTIVNFVVFIILLFTLVFEDKINGFFAGLRMIKGTEKANAVFYEDYLVSATEIGKTEFYYKNIKFIAENKDYFVFLLDKNHAQIYDKNSLKSNNVDEFRNFIKEKTKSDIKVIK